MSKGLNILITGSTSTIGESIVKEFSPNNSLYLIHRNSAKDKLLKILNSTFPDVEFDVFTDTEGLERVNFVVEKK